MRKKKGRNLDYVRRFNIENENFDVKVYFFKFEVKNWLINVIWKLEGFKFVKDVFV